MKNAFVIVTLSSLLAACAVVPNGATTDAGRRPASGPVSDLVAVTDEGDAADTEAASDEKLPNVALTPELLYQMMRAELDFKEGNWQAPYASMMGMAQQTRDPRLARRAAEMALSGKKNEEALAAISLWRQLAPDSEEALQYYLGFAVTADKLDDAEALLRTRLAEASPAARPLAMFQAQQYLSRARDKAAATAVLQRLLMPYMATLEARVVLAQAAFARGANELALSEAQAALAINPRSEVAVLTLAQVTPDQAEVASLLGKFVAANPTAQEARAALARVLVTQKQYEQARKEFLALLKDQPDNLGTLYALGIMSMQLDEPAAAEKYLAQFIKVHTANPSDERDPAKVLMMLAQLAEDRGDLKAAREWLEQVDEDEPATFFSAQIRRAQLLGKGGDLAGADALLSTLKPEDAAGEAQVVLARGQILRDAGKLADAYTLMQAGAARYPANTDLLYDFALLAEKTGHPEVMEQTLRQVMELAPDSHHAYNALGYSLAERNVRLDEAAALVAKALKLSPDDPFIMDSMGWVQYRLGKLDEAADYLRRAYALRPDVEIAVHLGEVLWHKGEKADAQKIWRQARAKDPKNDTLKSTLARLHLNL